MIALLADVRGTDLTTYYTHAHPETLFGAGLQAERSRVSLERVHLDQSQTGGLFAFNDDTSIELRDVVISNSYRSGCLDEVDRCASFVGGIGLGVYDGAQVVLERFRLEGNELIGAQVARGLDEHEEPNEAVGDLELRGGVVTRSLVGVNVAAEGYDLRKVSAQVWFSENGRDIETSVLPTPPPLER